MRADASFSVMGTTADITVVGGPRALVDVARGRLTDLERRWSRFIPTSEVSRLNRAEGIPRRVSSETRLLVQRALEGHDVTGGRFDPTLLGAVLRAGYVESFDQLGHRHRPRRVASSYDTGARRIEVDESAGTVRIPIGVGFDPGGIGKGLAADLVAEELVKLGADGHVRERRRRPPRARSAAGRRSVAGRGGRTLGRRMLRWRSSGCGRARSRRARGCAAAGCAKTASAQHHLVDPLTGGSSHSPVLAATAVAAGGLEGRGARQGRVPRRRSRARADRSARCRRARRGARRLAHHHRPGPRSSTTRRWRPARDQPAVVVHRARRRDRRLGAARLERRVGSAALDPAPPGRGPTRVDARPPSLPRRPGGDLRRRARRRDRARLLRPLRSRGRARARSPRRGIPSGSRGASSRCTCSLRSS